MAEVDARRAAAEVLRQRAVAEGMLAELKAVAGMQMGESLVLRDDLEQLSKLPELSGARLTDALQTAGERPDVRLADAQVRVAAANLNLTRLSAKPDITINTSYMRMGSSFPLFGLDASGTPAPIQGVFHNVSIGAVLTLPLRDGDRATSGLRSRE
jgi:outer membrane protein TolC